MLIYKVIYSSLQISEDPNKLLATVCALLLAGGIAQAGPISADKARTEAATFLAHQQGAGGPNRVKAVQATLKLAYSAVAKSQSQDAAYYVFNKGA